ncbi:MAG: hypothetical protein H6837_02060 [Planctomycetes bacterium]|nr:hypothetical protein [Planctomycetota bacterium]
MKIALALALALAASSLTAQTVTTLGGTTNTSARTLNGKGNAILMNASVTMLSFEMYLNIPGPETLTFYIYRHHTDSGTFNLMKSWNVQVNGSSAGTTWYSSGIVPTPLLCGNSYILGVSWNTSVTYHYSIGTCRSPFALGTWLSGSTVNQPPPQTESVGCDSAQYYQRITTTPLPAVSCVGTGCAGTSKAPRLVPATPPVLGTTLTLDLVDGVGSTPALMLLSPFKPLPTPIPVLGCSVWVDLSQPYANLTGSLSSAGQWTLSIPIPNSTIYRGQQITMQAGVLGSRLDTSTAVDLTVY